MEERSDEVEEIVEKWTGLDVFKWNRVNQQEGELWSVADFP
jgi:hypothetical protein